MQEGKEVSMRALQTMDRERYIQSVARATAKCMTLLSLLSARLQLVNGNGQDYEDKRNEQDSETNEDSRQEGAVTRKKMILTRVVDLLIDKRIRKMRSERSIR